MALEEEDSHSSSSASLSLNQDCPFESSSSSSNNNSTSKLNAQAPAFVPRISAPGRVYATRLHQINVTHVVPVVQNQFIYAPQQSPPSPYYGGVARGFVDQEVAAADSNNSAKNGGLPEEAAQKIVNQVFKSVNSVINTQILFSCLLQMNSGFEDVYFHIAVELLPVI